MGGGFWKRRVATGSSGWEWEGNGAANASVCSAQSVRVALGGPAGVEQAWPYWDGRAAERIVLCLLFTLGEEDAHLS